MAKKEIFRRSRDTCMVVAVMFVAACADAAAIRETNVSKLAYRQTHVETPTPFSVHEQEVLDRIKQASVYLMIDLGCCVSGSVVEAGDVFIIATAKHNLKSMSGDLQFFNVKGQRIIVPQSQVRYASDLYSDLALIGFQYDPSYFPYGADFQPISVNPDMNPQIGDKLFLYSRDIGHRQAGFLNYPVVGEITGQVMLKQGRVLTIDQLLGMGYSGAGAYYENQTGVIGLTGLVVAGIDNACVEELTRYDEMRAALISKISQ